MSTPTISRNQRLLRPKQAEEYLGVTTRELRSLREQGKVVAVKIGHRTLRYDRKDLDALIESWKQPVKEFEPWDA